LRTASSKRWSWTRSAPRDTPERSRARRERRAGAPAQGRDSGSRSPASDPCARSPAPCFFDLLKLVPVTGAVHVAERGVDLRATLAGGPCLLKHDESTFLIAERAERHGEQRVAVMNQVALASQIDLEVAFGHRSAFARRGGEGTAAIVTAAFRAEELR